VSLFRNRNGAWFVYGAGFLLFLTLWPARSFTGDANLPPLDPGFRIWAAFVLGLWLFGYALLLRAREPFPQDPRALAALGLGALALCFLSPMFSGDIHEYLIRGRILAVYHQSPYGHTPSEYPGDLFAPLSTWRNLPMDYGPAAGYLQAAASLPFVRSAAGTVFFYKFMMLGFYALLIWSLLRLCGELKLPGGTFLALAAGFNPPLIAHTLADGHNDLPMLALCVLSVYFLVRGHQARCMIAWTLAFLIKYSSALLFPFLAVGIIKHVTGQGGGRRLVCFFAGIAACLGITVLSYFPFRADLKTHFMVFGYLGKFYTNTLPYAIHQFLSAVGFGVSEDGVSLACKLLSGLVILAVFLVSVRKAESGSVLFFRAICLCHAAFFFQVSAPFHAWYLLWMLPWIVFSRWPCPAALLTLYSAVMLFAYAKRVNYLIILASILYVLWCFLSARLRKDARIAG